MENILHMLSEFDPISLDKMDGVALMDRTDTKFVFRQEHLPELLQNILPHYRVLEVNGIRASKYETLYFDTRDFRLYMEHHKGKLNRYKIRHRIYVDSGLHFFEVKYKNNKGRTIKSRVKKKNTDTTIDGRSELLLKQHTCYTADCLVPKLWSNCYRITMVSRHGKERLTLDIDLTFKNARAEKTLSNIVIAEVKRDKLSSSYFIDLMKRHRIREGSVSKYCLGVVLLYDDVKKNNFKPGVQAINKLCENDASILFVNSKEGKIRENLYVMDLK